MQVVTHHKQHYLRLVTLQIILLHLVIAVIVFVAAAACQSNPHPPILTT